jgi:hypothetical protein
VSQTNQSVTAPRIGGLLLRGALARLQVAILASLGLWILVAWASLSHPVPPKQDAPPPPSPPTLRRIVGTGQPTPIGGTFDRFDVESQPIVAPVNANGQVAFYATILRNKSTEGIFVTRSDHITKVAAVGDSVPGGGILTQFAQHPIPSLNDSGTVTFGAAMSSAQAAEGIFMAKDGTLTVIAVVGGDAPGVVGGTFARLDTPSMNNRDEVVFVATVRHGRDTFEALYLYSNGRLRKLLAEGDPYLGGGFFDQFGVPAINNRGAIALAVTVDHGPVLGGIFVTGTRDLKLLLGSGAPAPGGRMILRFSERLAIDDEDSVAFGAHLSSGANRSEALLRVNSSGVTTIAAVGDPAPGGGKFVGFGEWPSVGPVGRVVFVAAVDNGAGPLGIFAWQAGILSRMVLAGEKLPDGSVLPPFALNPVTSAGANGGVSFATMGDAEAGGGSRIYYFGPPPR